MKTMKPKVIINQRFPTICPYRYTFSTIEAAHKIPAGTISEHEHRRGMSEGSPLIICMDALLSYATWHRARFESKLSDDYVLGPEWLEAVKGIRGLLNGDTLKDNGAVEDVFWQALEIAGFTEKDL